MKSLYFDSEVTWNAETGRPEYDRAADANDLRTANQAFVTNGVYPNPSTNFQVFAGPSDMTTIVYPGMAWLQGAFGYDTENATLTHQAAHASLPRIDRVVLRVDFSVAVRAIVLDVLEGTPASAPLAPPLTRTNTIHERAIADVLIPANTTVITDSRITDTRMDTELCGWVTGAVDQVDTSTIFSQYVAWLEETQGSWDVWLDATKETWTRWWEDQQDTTGYLTVNGTYSGLNTTSKQIIGAINEVNGGAAAEFTTTLPTTGWATEDDGVSRTVSVAGLLATGYWHSVMPSTDAGYVECGKASVRPTAISAGSITFKAKKAPSIAIPISIIQSRQEA